MEVATIGAPEKYDPKFIPIAKALAAKGFIDIEICEVLGVSKATFINWKNRHPEFDQAVDEGKASIDTRVQNAMLQRALGYDYKSEKIVVLNRGHNDGSYYERVPITVHMPPDPGTCFNWLKNRDPEKWKDRVETNHSGSIEFKVIPDEIVDNPDE